MWILGSWACFQQGFETVFEEPHCQEPAVTNHLSGRKEWRVWRRITLERANDAACHAQPPPEAAAWIKFSARDFEMAIQGFQHPVVHKIHISHAPTVRREKTNVTTSADLLRQEESA